MILINSKVWSASADGCVCVWDPNIPIKLIKQIQCHTRGTIFKFYLNVKAINSLCHTLHNENSFIWSASDDKTIKITDTANFKFIKRLKGHTDYINTLAVINKKVWSASEDKSVAVWDVNFKFVKRLPHDKVFVISCEFYYLECEMCCQCWT